MFQFLRGVIVLAALSVFACPANCLEYSFHENDKSKTLTALLAAGTIGAGDTERLQKFLRRLTPKKNIAIYLASPGGNLYEGMKLGLFFHRHRIRTVVEGGHDCASACALAFLQTTKVGVGDRVQVIVALDFMPSRGLVPKP